MSDNNAASTSLTQVPNGTSQSRTLLTAQVQNTWHQEVQHRERFFQEECWRRDKWFMEELQRRDQAFASQLQQLQNNAQRREQELLGQIRVLKAQVTASGSRPFACNDNIVMQQASQPACPSFEQSEPAFQSFEQSQATNDVDMSVPENPPAVQTDEPPSGEPTRKRRRTTVSVNRRSSAVEPSAQAPPPPQRATGNTRAYQITQAQVPKDAVGIQRALQTHVRVLWRLSSHTVPITPPQHVLDDFDARFPSKPALQSVTPNSPEFFPPSLVEVAPEVTTSQGEGTHVLTIPTPLLDYIRSYMARYGIQYWSPDLLGDAYSMYNTAHRLIAIATFKEGVTSGAYDHFAPNRTYITDLPLITHLYDHFVHHYQVMRFRREVRNPGSAASATELSKSYKRRTRLAKARADFAKKAKLPERYIEIVGNPKATSDDEWDPNLGAYAIKRRPERSEIANRFFRIFDEWWERTVKLEGRWKRQPRAVPPEQKDTEYPRLPTEMPLDYFDPDFYNSLHANYRRRLADGSIAFPPDSSTILQPPDYAIEKLTPEELMEKYGEEIKQKYDVPGSDVEDEGDETVQVENEDDGMLGDGENFEETGVVPERAEFVEFMNMM